MSLLIYTPKATNRLQYIFSLMFNRLMGMPYSICTSKEEFLAYLGPRLNYSESPIGDIPFIASRQLLTERGIKEFDLKVENDHDTPIFFLTWHKQSLLRFDVFCAAFYMVSRYEEYLPYIKDKYDRFDAQESLAFKNGFLQMPVVNIWSEMLKVKLLAIYPAIELQAKKYRFIPTYDIDASFAYKYKGLVRTIGGFIKDFRDLDFAAAKERLLVLSGKLRDPFDTYHFQLELQEKYRLNPVYFILFADYGVNDKNTPIDHKRFQELIKTLADYADIGIHPSFTSNSHPEKLKNEVFKLGIVLNKEIRKSRQHFLKLYFPSTYRNLLNLDITDDYTMGFASHPGFRAGICDTFPFYDLESETETSMMIHPFALMDGTLKDYLNLSPEEALSYSKKLIDSIKSVNGTLITLWHNESLSDQKRWVHWRDVYVKIIEYALPDKAGK